MVQALSGIDLRVYRITSTFYDIPDLGAEKLAFKPRKAISVRLPRAT